MKLLLIEARCDSKLDDKGRVTVKELSGKDEAAIWDKVEDEISNMSSYFLLTKKEFKKLSKGLK